MNARRRARKDADRAQGALRQQRCRMLLPIDDEVRRRVYAAAKASRQSRQQPAPPFKPAPVTIQPGWERRVMRAAMRRSIRRRAKLAVRQRTRKQAA